MFKPKEIRLIEEKTKEISDPCVIFSMFENKLRALGSKKMFNIQCEADKNFIYSQNKLLHP